MEKKRADLILVVKNLAGSRTKAQELIANGLVRFQIKNKIVNIQSSNEKYFPEEVEQIFIQTNDVEKYVSRAGLKMEGALKQYPLVLENSIALDVGISTGGFSDCLLQMGVAAVVGIDVGRDQIHPKLKANPRLTLLEGLNAKELATHQEFLKKKPAVGFDLAVVDVSFISALSVLPSILPHLKKRADLILLIKPQFEAGPNALDKNGIIRDPKLYPELLSRLTSEIEKLGCEIKKQFESFPSGKDGNREFFFCIQKSEST